MLYTECAGQIVLGGKKCQSCRYINHSDPVPALRAKEARGGGEVEEEGGLEEIIEGNKAGRKGGRGTGVRVEGKAGRMGMRKERRQ